MRLSSMLFGCQGLGTFEAILLCCVLSLLCTQCHIPALVLF